MKTINDFIKELQRISPDKRELPLIIYAPNGLECSPEIKMGVDSPSDMFEGNIKKMVITY